MTSSLDAHLPIREVPLEHTPESWLREVTSRGAFRRYGDPCGPEVTARISRELEVIADRGAVRYMLVVADYVNWARSEGIWVGPGRGSTAGSVVAYALGITELDPLRHGLLFERFLSQSVPPFPDIDVDIEWGRRHEVVNYLVRRYGGDAVASIANFSPGRPVHASGLLVADRPIHQIVPVTPLSQSDETKWPHAVKLRASLDYVECQALGLPKFDLLALRALRTLRCAVDAVERNHGKTIVPWSSDVPLDDRAALQLLATEDATGLFQLDGRLLRECLRELQPTQFEDLVAMVALHRREPIGRGLPWFFIERKHARVESLSVHPELDRDLAPILEETRGLLVYQEQAMQVARSFAGMSYDEAELCRRDMMSTLEHVRVNRMREFAAGAEASGYSKEAAEALSEWISEGLFHATCKAHATSCALITYWGAYLKAHFPVEFDEARRAQ